MNVSDGVAIPISVSVKQKILRHVENHVDILHVLMFEFSELLYNHPINSKFTIWHLYAAWTILSCETKTFGMAGSISLFF